MINILYICTPTSIHDIKWISFFSKKEEDFKTYVLSEKQIILKENDKRTLADNNIVLLDELSSFTFSRPLQTIKTIRKIKEYISQYNISIVHIMVPTPYALWLNFINIPFIITTRGTDVLLTLPELRKKWYRIKKIIFHFLYKRVFRKARYITSTSIAQIENIKKLYDTKSNSLIRTGVDVEKINSMNYFDSDENDLKNRKFVFSPRYIDNPLYNTELQIEAIALLDREILDNYTFVFINYGKYNLECYNRCIKNLERLKEAININYLVLGRLTQDTLWQFYNNASLTMMTPLSDGTPNTALESMAARCPLIIPNLSYDENLFNKNTCLKLKDNSPECLAQLISKALTGYSHEMLNNAFNIVSLFGNREVEMTKLKDLYMNIS